VSPVGGARFDAAGLPLGGFAVRITTAFSADYLVDPILRIAGPRGTLSTRLGSTSQQLDRRAGRRGRDQPEIGAAPW